MISTTSDRHGTDGPGDQVLGAVLALKPLAEAKSRLDLPAPLRRRLGLAMFLDTLAVITQVADQTVVVSRQPALRSILTRAGIPTGVRVIPDQRSGLNAAFRQGEGVLRGLGCTAVVACVGDLPTLRADDLRRAWASARGRSRSFVPDASGVGTCLLFATDAPLDPRFQGTSATKHADSGAEPLLGGEREDLAALRADVDTADDLRRAVGLGLGPTTSALVDPATGELGRWAPVTVAEPPDTVITEDGRRLRFGPGARPVGAHGLRTGQRLDAVVAGDEVLTSWW